MAMRKSNAARGAHAGTEVMTVNEVAAFYRIDVSTVIRLAKSGQIPGTKIGKQWRFRRDAIQATTVGTGAAQQ